MATRADGYRNNTGHLVAELNPTDRFQLRFTARRTESESQYDATSFLTGLPADSDSATERTHTLAGLQGRLTLLDGRWLHHGDITHSASENHNFASGAEIGETSGDKLRLSYQTTFFLPSLSWNAGERRRPAFEEGGTAVRAMPSLPASPALADGAGGIVPSITLGLGHEREDYLQRAAASFFGDPNRDLSTRSTEALAEFRVDARTRWSASAALRYDRNRDFGNALSWRASAVRHVGRGITLHAAYGLGVKNPTFVERFGYFTNFIGNPDLLTEESRGWEAGVGYAGEGTAGGGGGFSGSLTWFSERLLDEINGFVFDPAVGGFTAANRPGVSRRRGLELQARWDAGAGFSLMGAYTYLHAKEPDATAGDVYELRRPRHTGNLNVHYALAVPALEFNLNLDFTGERTDIFFPPWPNPSRRVTLDSFLHASFTSSWQATPRMRWHVRADNLGQARYEEVYGFQGPGRSIHLGVQLTLFEK